MNATSNLNTVIIGAGPAGLGASIGLARKGIAVTVIEQQEKLGSVRRGETIRADMHMEEILGHGFFEHIAIRKVHQRRYFSHTGKCQKERVIKNPNIIFSWPDLINEMVSQAGNSGVRFLTGLHVTELIEQSGRVSGVMASKNGVAEELLADTVISCGGCHDPASHHIRQDRSGIDMAVTKRLVRGYTGQERQLEYHFHIKPTGILVGRCSHVEEVRLSSYYLTPRGETTFNRPLMSSVIFIQNSGSCWTRLTAFMSWRHASLWGGCSSPSPHDKALLWREMH